MSDQLDRPLADSVTYKGVRLSDVPGMAAKIKRLEERNDWVETQYAAVQQERDKAELACKRLEGELAEARKERDLIGGRHNKRANTAEAERDEARKRCETLAGLLNAASGWIQCTDNCSIHNGRECDCGAADVLAKAESVLASEQEGTNGLQQAK